MTRSKTKIVVDILETVKNEDNCSKTKIIRKANLDWDMASKYIKSLLGEGFIKNTDNNSRGKYYYKITERGKLLLKSLKKARKACSIL